MRRKTLAVASLSTAALFAVAGCGSTSVQSLGNIKLSGAEAVIASAQQAEQVKSYTVDLTADISGTEGHAGKLQGRMNYQADPLAADVTIDSASFGGQNLPGGARAILHDNTVYLKLDLLRTVAGATKPWVKVPLDKVKGEHGTDPSQVLDQVRQFDLANATKLLTASKDVKPVGTETVGGVETTHYSGTFPTDAASAQLPEKAREHALKSFAQLKDVKFDLWADAQNLPRKITLSGSAEGSKLDVALNFKGFNEPVEISAPPADQVGEFPKIDRPTE
ncbi:LppX_LprAFG lipoprotein [Sinosporangium siamense]|uniref:Lipoprotein n=1 Tax=Sinosporangium siamense TaxID=1367973 RepID=A0A919RH76_9ACTN|nr:LppX_LprAFG lipoprotein [Sinosporangium siamense]GII93297.1 putative lipoprotein [Sinosporangium siamense]